MSASIKAEFAQYERCVFEDHRLYSQNPMFINNNAQKMKVQAAISP